MSEDKPMLERRKWEEFQATGLLWFVNRMLHLFGWAIVLNVESDGTVFEAYPARSSFRGFDEKSETEGFKKITKHLAENVAELLEETLR